MSKQRKNKMHTETITAPIYMSRRGRGFILHPKTGKKIQIEENHTGKAFNRDIVRVTYSTNKLEGVVDDVVERNRTDFVGTLEEAPDFFYLIPLDKKIHLDFVVPKEKTKGAKNNDVVLVTLDSWKDVPEAHVKTIIGPAGTNDTEMNAIAFDRGFVPAFPERVLQEARKLKEKQKESIATALTVRKDYRDVLTITIDPADAKDFDDAISFKENKNGDFEIGVHIADVSHYVQEKTELDRSAIERGTSVYLVDRTIPMLPEVISNDLCSLNPNEDKLAFSIIFTFSKDSLSNNNYTILDTWIGETVIHSERRYSYEEAQKIIETGVGDNAEAIKVLNTLAKKIAKQNTENGALNFDQEEVKFHLDENGHPIDVFIKEQKDSNHLVEQFMLLANRSVTEYVSKSIPEKERLFIYRVHDKPEQERVSNLVGLLRGLGYTVEYENSSISTKSLNAILAESKETPEANMIQTATIRSMAKAVYSTKNIGHFGLAFKDYTHFTSPIRRYPDILVHRLLKMYLAGKRVPENLWGGYDSMTQTASLLEQAAADAERASIKMKQIEYINDHKTEIFTGIISGVTEWGIYVQEKTSKAEGLIRFKDLSDDYYTLDQKNMRVVGKKANNQYRLGDDICVKVTKVDIEEQTIDLKPVECPTTNQVDS